MFFKYVVIFFSLFILSFCDICAQNPQKKEHVHSPRKATIYSAIMPGLGQAYNRKYWKLPIVYGAFGTLGYLIYDNNNNYKTFRQAYQYRTDEDISTIDDFVGIYNDDNLKTLRDFYRRNFELTCILTFVVYVVNVLDATVDAHLFDFKIDENLSFKIEPTLNNNFSFKNNNLNSGIKLTLNF